MDIFASIRIGPIGLALVSVLLEPAGARAAPPVLPDPLQQVAPHKALYQISLSSRKSSAPFVDITGKVFLELNKSCDAWTTDYRFRVEYDYSDNTPLRVDDSLSSYEPFDGQSLNFSARHVSNGQMYKEFSGSVTRRSDGTSLVHYTAPENEDDVVLKKGTLYPVLHTVELVRAAVAGRRAFDAEVFDGSDDDGPYEISSIIGRPLRGLDVVKAGPHINKALLDMPAWKVRMAYFQAHAQETEPDYEMDAVVQQNGIISDMRVDYKDFSIDQKLVGLEPLKPVACQTP